MSFFLHMVLSNNNFQADLFVGNILNQPGLVF